jgi:glutathione S-transferase
LIRLYDYENSSDCYKARLLLGLIGARYERIALDIYPGREDQAAWFRRINPLGEVPVLDHDGFVVRNAQAILVYLADAQDQTGRWRPAGDARLTASIAMWLGFAEALSVSAGAARLHDTVFHDEVDIDLCRAKAHGLLRVLDEHLWFAEQAGGGWLCDAAHPTIADIACFPDVMLSEEGGVMRLAYPAINRWLERVKRIAGFTTMSGVFPAAPPV